jgi:hypothetical protein
MEFKVGSMGEINYIAQIIQKQCKDTIDEKILNDENILDVKEYNYLKYLVFKYCLIPNAAL